MSIVFPGRDCKVCKLFRFEEDFPVNHGVPFTADAIDEDPFEEAKGLAKPPRKDVCNFCLLPEMREWPITTQ